MAAKQRNPSVCALKLLQILFDGADEMISFDSTSKLIHRYVNNVSGEKFAACRSERESAEKTTVKCRHHIPGTQQKQSLAMEVC